MSKIGQIHQDFAQNPSISTEEAIKKGYTTPLPIPDPVRCEYCGSILMHYGLRNPFAQNSILIWCNSPERCTCSKAKRFWAEWDKKEAERIAKELADKQKAEEMKRFERLVEISGMGARFRNRRFSTYICDTDKQKRALEQAKKYADNFEYMLPKKDDRGNISMPKITRNGLFITGSYGTGKTHLAAAIANQLIENETACICMTMIDLLDKIRDTFQANQSSELNETEILSKYETVPLLIIDDIGSEKPTEWAISKMFAIINARYESYMPTVITTNYSSIELEKRMTPKDGDSNNAKKTLDRLKETCVAMEMNWKSYREN